MLVLLMCVGRSIQRLLGKHIPGEIDLQLCVARRSTSGAGLDIENNYCEMQGVHDELNEDEVAGHCGDFGRAMVPCWHRFVIEVPFLQMGKGVRPPRRSETRYALKNS